MKKIYSVLIAVCIIIQFACISYADIVDIDSKVNDESNPIVLSLDAGTYNVIPIGVQDDGVYDAWNAWGFTQGCDEDGANCTKGWLNTYYLSSSEFSEKVISDGIKYANATLALDNALSTSFILTSDADVSFYIEDSPSSDNVGGMSLNVSRAATVPCNEFRVNTFYEGHQSSNDVAMNDNGYFVIVWEDASGQDGDSNGVFGQQFNPSGDLLNGQFQVNTTTIGGQSGGNVAIDSEGNFVVVWSDLSGDDHNIMGKLYDANGNVVKDEFRVNTTLEFNQIAPDVAMDAVGNFVVVWRQAASGAEGIYGRCFDAGGTPLGDEFKINDRPQPETNADAQVAMRHNRSFVVTWGESDDGNGSGIYRRRYDASCLPLEDPQSVNTTTADDQQLPAIAINDFGDFVIAWQSKQQDGDGLGIFARTFDASGNQLCGEFLVNNETAGDQSRVDVAMKNSGEFTITWTSPPLVGSVDIFARDFNTDCTPKGGQYRVNITTDGHQLESRIGIDANGRSVITWDDFSGQDGSSSSIYARLLPCIGPCLLDFDLSFTGGTLNMDFTVGSTSPATWNVYLSVADIAIPLFSIPLPALDPPISVPISIPGFPDLGGIGVLTTLTTADGIICSDWETVDTSQ